MSEIGTGGDQTVKNQLNPLTPEKNDATVVSEQSSDVAAADEELQKVEDHTSGVDQKPRRRRRKIRPKVVAEGKTHGHGNGPVITIADAPRNSKRKYVRKHEEDLPGNIDVEEEQRRKHQRKQSNVHQSARRVVNFEELPPPAKNIATQTNNLQVDEPTDDSCNAREASQNNNNNNNNHVLDDDAGGALLALSPQADFPTRESSRKPKENEESEPRNNVVFSATQTCGGRRILRENKKVLARKKGTTAIIDEARRLSNSDFGKKNRRSKRQRQEDTNENGSLDLHVASSDRLLLPDGVLAQLQCKRQKTKITPSEHDHSISSNVLVVVPSREDDQKALTCKEDFSCSVSIHPTFSQHNILEPMDHHLVQKLVCQNMDDIARSFVGNENSLIVQDSNGTMVPYNSLSNPPKKSKSRARVDLDSETNRVWLLLMGTASIDAPQGTDDEMERWWEEERRVFKGRVDSFIARMHLIQGDRRFSPWKGSVVDSVVGVFLTQNVSEILSSSAFMKLVARFPIRTTQNGAIYLVEIDSCTKEQERLAKESMDSQDHEYTKSPYNEAIDLNPNSSNSSVKGCNKSPIDLLLAEDGDMWDAFSKFSFMELLQAGSNELNYFPHEDATGARYGKDSSVTLEKLDVEKNEPSPSVHTAELIDSSGLTSHNIASSARKEFQGTISKISNQVSSQQYMLHHPILPDGMESSSIGKEQIKTSTIATESNPEEKKVQKEVADGGKRKRKRVENKSVELIDWDLLRKQGCNGAKKQRSRETMDSVDWEAIRCADVSELSDCIRERGMNNRLAERIKEFLDRLVKDHGSIDLEWLRSVPPEKVKDYLLSVKGLGLKSTECVRLLTLQHHAFPVDTNVGRICVRLGWVPLQPLPESLQLHLLELYPMLDTIQKHLWPRLCKLDQRTLYELHYQMITFGKVFCTKVKPNCNACPMRGDCRHFASAFASARLALPGPEEKGRVTLTIPAFNVPQQINNCEPQPNIRPIAQPPPEDIEVLELSEQEISNNPEEDDQRNSQPIVEEPTTPEPEIEDLVYEEEPDEIPNTKLNIERFVENLQNIMQESTIELQETDISKALVALTPDVASIPQPKLKNVSRLRTEHHVYELPDSHPLVEGLDRRETDDPSPYLLAIWSPGESAESMELPQSSCDSQATGILCTVQTCSVCTCIREERTQTVRGTILIPCRTAMRGSFPLNGTYFQVNEVFADHSSSLNPIEIPRNWIWNLPRCTVYFGTSVTTIFKGMTTEAIQQCFWRGFVCMRGFDRQTRAPRPLVARLHFPASKVQKKKRGTNAKEKQGR